MYKFGAQIERMSLGMYYRTRFILTDYARLLMTATKAKEAALV